MTDTLMTENDKSGTPSRRRRPPPVPLRTFQGTIKIPSDDVFRIKIPGRATSSNNSSDERSESSTPRDIILQQKDDVFDDIGDSDDLVIFDKKTNSLESNQSSSDSNRSQTTINTDTGYVSSFENDRIVTKNKRQFRARFASEDTQSSLDSSYMLQRADTIDSLQTNFTDSPFSLKKTNVFNFDRINYRMPSNGSIDSENKSVTPTKQQFKPAVPARKNKNVPPTPPRNFDSGKLIQNGQILGAFNSSNPANDTQNNPNETTTNNPPSLQSTTSNNYNVVRTKSKKVHSTKVNQRQDSNLSSDSYSMISSPGFNSKNMEVPLLQSTRKFKKSKDNNFQKNIHGKINVRQDSNLSSDSQTFNYNSKITDTPLIVHAVKMHKSEYKISI